MKAAIDSITIKERIRKEITRIPELAADIEINGLLHPVTVMTIDGAGYSLLAGLRRIRAAQSLGWAEIDVKVVAPADAEAALKIEISENEQREEFTYSEKMDYARLIEVIIKAKANERMLAGKKHTDPTDLGPEGQKRETRDIVGEKINMSGKQYDRAKYIADNAPSEVIDQLDKGERTIRATYDELRAKERAASVEPDAATDGEPARCGTAQLSEQSTDIPAVSDASESGVTPKAEAPREASGRPRSKVKLLSEMEAEGSKNNRYITRLEAEAAEADRRREAFDSMTPEGKIEELQRQIREWRASDATLQSDLANLRQRYDITVDHKDSIIEYLKKKNDELREALGAAYERITELVVESGGIPPVFPKMGKMPIAIDAITMQPIQPLDEDGQ